jgi:hypothetical protein
LGEWPHLVQLCASPSGDFVFRPNSRAASNSPAAHPGPSPRLSPQRGGERGISHHFDRLGRLGRPLVGYVSAEPFIDQERRSFAIRRRCAPRTLQGTAAPGRSCAPPSPSCAPLRLRRSHDQGRPAWPHTRLAVRLHENDRSTVRHSVGCGARASPRGADDCCSLVITQRFRASDHETFVDCFVIGQCVESHLDDVLDGDEGH